MSPVHMIQPVLLPQIESEFPEILPIRESLIKHVFEPNAKLKAEVCAAVREMRGR